RLTVRCSRWWLQAQPDRAAESDGRSRAPGRMPRPRDGCLIALGDAGALERVAEFGAGHASRLCAPMSIGDVAGDFSGEPRSHLGEDPGALGATHVIGQLFKFAEGRYGLPAAFPN